MDQLGTDLTVVNAARISYGNEHKELTDQDVRLMKYLANHRHYSPFRHCMLQVRIRAPEFVMRQLYKHVVGIEATSTHPVKDHAWNEISGRYRPYTEVYAPKSFHAQHTTARQCSGDVHPEHKQVEQAFLRTIETSMTTYHQLLEQGVAREQARMLLPMSLVTEVVWTASLQAVHHFVQLRHHADAQYEIRALAERLREIAVTAFPHAYQALNPTLSNGKPASV